MNERPRLPEGIPPPTMAEAHAMRRTCAASDHTYTTDAAGNRVCGKCGVKIAPAPPLATELSDLRRMLAESESKRLQLLRVISRIKSAIVKRDDADGMAAAMADVNDALAAAPANFDPMADEKAAMFDAIMSGAAAISASGQKPTPTA